MRERQRERERGEGVCPIMHQERRDERQKGEGGQGGKRESGSLSNNASRQRRDRDKKREWVSDK